MHVSARLTAASAADQSSFLSNLFTRHFLENAYFIGCFEPSFLIQPASAGK
jgi:hypothetical protein